MRSLRCPTTGCSPSPRLATMSARLTHRRTDSGGCDAVQYILGHIAVRSREEHSVRTFWFADEESVPEFWETRHEPTGFGINRAVVAPESGVKGVRAVELSTFSFPVGEEAEDARSIPGVQASGLVDQLVESGVRLPKRVVDFAYRDEPGESVTNRARTDLLVIDGVTYYASTWQIWVTSSRSPSSTMRG